MTLLLVGCLEVRADYPKRDLETLDNVDLNFCQNACYEKPKCNAFTWLGNARKEKENGSCFLKDTKRKTGRELRGADNHPRKDAVSGSGNTPCPGFPHNAYFEKIHN